MNVALGLSTTFGDADLFRIPSTITTPLMLLALAVVAFYAYRVVRVRADSNNLRQLPDEHRLALAERLANKYGVPVDDLAPGDRTQIVLQELQRRSHERRQISWFAFAAFVLTAVLWFASQRDLAPIGEPSPTPMDTLGFVSEVTYHPSGGAYEPVRTKLLVENGYAGGMWSDSVLTLRRLAYGRVRAGHEAFLIEIELRNTAVVPIAVDLHEGYFSLEDDRGVPITMASFCCRQEVAAPLRPGQSRTVQLVFTGSGWHGKDLGVHTFYFRVHGLMPVREAEWSFHPLMTMALVASSGRFGPTQTLVRGQTPNF